MEPVDQNPVPSTALMGVPIQEGDQTTLHRYCGMQQWNAIEMWTNDVCRKEC